MNYQIIPQQNGGYYLNLFAGHAWFDSSGVMWNCLIPQEDFYIQLLVQAAQEIAIAIVARKAQAAYLSRYQSSTN